MSSLEAIVSRKRQTGVNDRLYQKALEAIANEIFSASAAGTRFSRLAMASNYDLRLTRDAKCIDAGVALPQVTDNFHGIAPDLGCYEFGQTVPQYGPRR